MASSTRLHAATIASFRAGDAEAAEQIRRRTILRQIARFPEMFHTEEDR
jgi:hypothetical protein